MGTSGYWEEFDPEILKTEIRKRAGNPDLSQALELSKKVRVVFEQKRDPGEIRRLRRRDSVCLSW